MKLNREYKEMTNDILDNENFKLLKNDIHHGTNKYDHCKRVSYLSFLLAKIFKADIKKTSRAGLLHDFFYGGRTLKEENSYLKHPITSAKNAREVFGIENEEACIIETHMYHYALFKRVMPFSKEDEKRYFEEYKPKNKNGVIVCVADLLVSFFEVCAFKVRYSACLYMLFLFNYIRF